MITAMKGLAGLGLVGLLAAMASAHGAGSGPLDRFAEGLNSYRAEFQQQVVDSGGRVIEESTGDMALMAPDRMRWHYREPLEQLGVADGENVFIYDVDLEQITVRGQQGSAANSPLYVLTNPDTLDDRFEVEDRGEFHGARILALLPREADAEFDWVELGLRDQLLESIVIQDAFGQQTRITFSRSQRNLELDPGSFQFEPPAGVDVIGQEELRIDAPDIDY